MLVYQRVWFIVVPTINPWSLHKETYRDFHRSHSWDSPSSKTWSGDPLITNIGKIIWNMERLGIVVKLPTPWWISMLMRLISPSFTVASFVGSLQSHHISLHPFVHDQTCPYSLCLTTLDMLISRLVMIFQVYLICTPIVQYILLITHILSHEISPKESGFIPLNGSYILI